MSAPSRSSLSSNGACPEVGDDLARLLAAVVDCRRRKSAVTIVGHGSKRLLGVGKASRNHLEVPAKALSTRSHSGIIEYRPEELVITARAGTPLVQLAAAVAAEGQLLPFDPPRFGGLGTFGGAIASGLSGPARPWRGSVRDAVLGVEIINGYGERLRFGGSVLKNVAGYDVSRLMTGSRGDLGLILSASVRLLPIPQVEATCRRHCGTAEAAALVQNWARLPLPITATCYLAGELWVRLSGNGAAITSAQAEMGLTETGDAGLWDRVRDHEHDFFAAAGTPRCPLTRLSLPRGCPLDGAALTEWGGCQAWLRGEAGAIPEGAFATVFPGGARRRATAADGTAKYAARIKHAFDPDGVFNSGIGL